MRDEIRRSGKSAKRTRTRKFAHPAGVAALIGVAAVAAVTPLLARGLVQMPAGLDAMPGTLHASASLSAGMPRFEPRQQSLAAENRFTRKIERTERVAAVADTVEAKVPAPRFADFDARRLSARPSPVRTLPAVEHYAWIDDVKPRSADAAPIAFASLDRRLAPARWLAAPDADSEPVSTAPAALAMNVSLPLTSAEDALASDADVASLETELSETIAVPKRRPERRESHTALAYASPNVQVEEEKSDGVFGRLFGKRGESLLPGRGSKVAVYDIGAATVYLPNGEKLEAHSGLAHMKDNPRYVAEKNKGPTPPNLYNLRMRESRFHGVEAIRLLPADGKKKFNRDGLLAHTYMYVAGGGRDRSQSNGCVVFKDYDRFLKAFKRGDIEHLIVVKHLKELPTYTAAL